MTSSHPDDPIARERRASLGLYVTAKEACDMWQADPDLKILDCRTPEEYVFVGHPPMAVNIPFAFQSFEWDAERRRDDPSLVPLRWSLRDGHRGDGQGRLNQGLQHHRRHGGGKVKDPESVFDGMRMKNGWKNSGLPWTYELDRERMRLPARESRMLHPGNEHD